MESSHTKRTIILLVTLFVSVIILVIMWQLNRYVAGLPPILKIDNYQVNKVTLTDQIEGAKIVPEDLIASCHGQDCLKSLNQPRLEATTTANYWLKDEDQIIGLVFDKVARAYPLRIIERHAVVNDVINLQPVMISYSPLTGSVAAYRPMVNGIQTQFGTSGLVRHSDIVLYDRLQGNLWQQLTGQAILGPAAQANETLTALPISLTSWKLWKQAHPDTHVLSKTTGYPFDYDQSAYPDYSTNDELRFKATYTNKTLPMKTRVYGLVLGDRAKAYPDSLISDKPLTDRVGTTTITLIRESDGTIKATKGGTNELLYPRPTYWFAWTAFYPQTQVYSRR